jgi:hypothetical protein
VGNPHAVILYQAVPGFVGSASIKWVEGIMVLREEFDGFYMKSNYTAPRADNDKEVYSLGSLEVKSIPTPSEGRGAPLRYLPTASGEAAGWHAGDTLTGCFARCRDPPSSGRRISRAPALAGRHSACSFSPSGRIGETTRRRSR